MYNNIYILIRVYVCLYTLYMLGMFDSHKAGKSLRLINGLWSLQVMQMSIVLIAPAIFAANSTIEVIKCAEFAPNIFGWSVVELVPGVAAAYLWLLAYFGLYIGRITYTCIIYIYMI